MKNLFVISAFILAACLLFSACGDNQAPAPSPTLSHTGEEETGFDFGDAESINEALAECYSSQIEEANKCRVKVGDNEYYFDTSKYILMDSATMDVEFPLYMNSKDGGAKFLGTIGYSFKVCEPYIYVESEQLWEDYPGREMIRVVNINDLSVTPFHRDAVIFVPDMQGDRVYYTFEIDDCIYIADPSLKNAKKLHIEVPDKDTIEQRIGLSIDGDLNEDISVTDVKNGRIFFSYEVFAYEGPWYYEGNYRIKTDGSKI